MPRQCKLVQQLELGWAAMALDYLHLGGVFLSWGSDSVNQRGVSLTVEDGGPARSSCTLPRQRSVSDKPGSILLDPLAMVKRVVGQEIVTAASGGVACEVDAMVLAQAENDSKIGGLCRSSPVELRSELC